MTPVPRRGRLEQHRPAPKWPTTDVRDRAALGHRDREHVLLRRLARLADGVGDFVGLAQADADAPLLVADRHDRVEREPAAALHHLGAAVDVDDPLDELGLGRRFRLARGRRLVASPWRLLELQSAVAGAVGERLDAPVVQVAAAVEATRVMPFSFARCGEQLADRRAHADLALALAERA